MARSPVSARDLSPRVHAVRSTWSFALLALWGATTAVVAVCDGPAITVAVVGFILAVTLPAVGARWTLRRMLRKALARFNAAHAGDDRAAIDASVAEIRSLLPGKVVAGTAAIVALTFVAEERWEEVLESLAHLEGVRLPEPQRVGCDNLRAWALVELGRAPEALPFAREAVDGARRIADPALPAYLDTLAVALIQTGDPSGALVALGEAAAHAGRDEAALAFHRGEALRALGRGDEAIVEYRRAIDATGAKRWGKRARERLADAFPYRE